MVTPRYTRLPGCARSSFCVTYYAVPAACGLRFTPYTPRSLRLRTFLVPTHGCHHTHAAPRLSVQFRYLRSLPHGYVRLLVRARHFAVWFLRFTVRALPLPRRGYALRLLYLLHTVCGSGRSHTFILWLRYGFWFCACTVITPAFAFCAGYHSCIATVRFPVLQFRLHGCPAVTGWFALPLVILPVAATYTRFTRLPGLFIYAATLHFTPAGYLRLPTVTTVRLLRHALPRVYRSTVHTFTGCSRLPLLPRGCCHIAVWFAYVLRFIYTHLAWFLWLLHAACRLVGLPFCWLLHLRIRSCVCSARFRCRSRFCPDYRHRGCVAYYYVLVQFCCTVYCRFFIHLLLPYTAYHGLRMPTFCGSFTARLRIWFAHTRRTVTQLPVTVLVPAGSAAVTATPSLPAHTFTGLFGYPSAAVPVTTHTVWFTLYRATVAGCILHWLRTLPHATHAPFAVHTHTCGLRFGYVYARFRLPYTVTRGYARVAAVTHTGSFTAVAVLPFRCLTPLVTVPVAVRLHYYTSRARFTVTTVTPHVCCAAHTVAFTPRSCGLHRGYYLHVTTLRFTCRATFTFWRYRYHLPRRTTTCLRGCVTHGLLHTVWLRTHVTRTVTGLVLRYAHTAHRTVRTFTAYLDATLLRLYRTTVNVITAYRCYYACCGSAAAGLRFCTYGLFSGSAHALVRGSCVTHGSVAHRTVCHTHLRHTVLIYRILYRSYWLPGYCGSGFYARLVRRRACVVQLLVLHHAGYSAFALHTRCTRVAHGLRRLFTSFTAVAVYARAAPLHRFCAILVVYTLPLTFTRTTTRFLHYRGSVRSRTHRTRYAVCTARLPFAFRLHVYHAVTWLLRLVTRLPFGWFTYTFCHTRGLLPLLYRTLRVCVRHTFTALLRLRFAVRSLLVAPYVSHTAFCHTVTFYAFTVLPHTVTGCVGFGYVGLPAPLRLQLRLPLLYARLVACIAVLRWLHAVLPDLALLRLPLSFYAHTLHYVHTPFTVYAFILPFATPYRFRLQFGYGYVTRTPAFRLCGCGYVLPVCRALPPHFQLRFG